MLRKTAVMVFIFVMITTSLVAGGNKEKAMVVPENAEVVIGVDLDGILGSELAKDSLDDMARLFPEGDFDSYADASAEIKEELGLVLEDIDMIYIFMPGLDLTGSDPDVGVSVKVNNMDRELIMSKIQEEDDDVEPVKYKSFEYFRVGEGQSFAIMETLFLFGTNSQILESMLDVLDGAPDVTKSGRIGPMVKEYGNSMFYSAALLPPELNEGLQTTMPGVDLVKMVMAVNVSDSVNINLNMESSTEEGASNVATSLQLALGVVGQMIPIDDPAVSEMVMKVLDPIEIGSEGNMVKISCVYSKEAIEEIQAMLPMVAALMGGGF